MVASALAQREQPTIRRFYIGVGVFVILLSIAGFGPALLDESTRRGPVTPLVIAHGALTIAYVFLFVAQATLIAQGREAVHRRLGVFVAIVAFAVVLLGVITSIVAQRRTYDLGGDLVRSGGGQPFTPDGILGPLVIFFSFGFVVAAALWYRNRPEIHKRLMVFALLMSLGLEPVIHLLGHMSIYWPALTPAVQGLIIFAVVLFFLSLNAIHDRLTNGPIHPVSIWLPIANFVFFNGMLFGFARLQVWFRFSEWLIGTVPSA
jgi:hypothetical protein